MKKGPKGPFRLWMPGVVRIAYVESGSLSEAIHKLVNKHFDCRMENGHYVGRHWPVRYCYFPHEKGQRDVVEMNTIDHNPDRGWLTNWWQDFMYRRRKPKHLRHMIWWERCSAADVELAKYRGDEVIP